MSVSKAYKWCSLLSDIFLVIGCLVIFPADDTVIHDLFQLCVAIGFLLFGVTYFLRKKMRVGGG